MMIEGDSMRRPGDREEEEGERGRKGKREREREGAGNGVCISHEALFFSCCSNSDDAEKTFLNSSALLVAIFVLVALFARMDAMRPYSWSPSFRWYIDTFSASDWSLAKRKTYMILEEWGIT